MIVKINVARAVSQILPCFLLLSNDKFGLIHFDARDTQIKLKTQATKPLLYGN